MHRRRPGAGRGGAVRSVKELLLWLRRTASVRSPRPDLGALGSGRSGRRRTRDRGRWRRRWIMRCRHDWPLAAVRRMVTATLRRPRRHRSLRRPVEQVKRRRAYGTSPCDDPDASEHDLRGHRAPSASADDRLGRRARWRAAARHRVELSLQHLADGADGLDQLVPSRRRQSRQRKERRHAPAESGTVFTERDHAARAVREMSACLPPRDLVRSVTREGRDRALTVSAQATAQVQHDEAIDLPLGAVERAQHGWLVDPKQARNSPPAQLLAPNEPIDGALSVVQLAQAVVDDPAVRG